VERICSFVDSQENLLNLRLLNHLFHTEATRQLRRVHRRPIKISTEGSVKKAIDCVKTRQALNLTPPFPFSTFVVDFHIRVETIETFATTVGQHIDRYSFRVRTISSGTMEEMSRKAVILLSHSPNLTELHIGSMNTSELSLSEGDLTLLPAYFPCLSYIGVSTSMRQFYLGPESPNPLIDLVIQRAPQLKTLMLPFKRPVMMSRIIKYFVQHRPNLIPALYQDNAFMGNPWDTYFKHELMDYNLVTDEILAEIQRITPLRLRLYSLATGFAWP